MNLIVRSSEGLTLLGGPPFTPNANLTSVSCTGATFSNDGTKLAVVNSSAVVVYEVESCKQIQSFQQSGVVSAVFSPAGTYIQTYKKAQGQEKNVVVWDVSTGATVLDLFQKSITKRNWPIIQFSDDETVACRLVTNGVQIYDAKDLSKGNVDHLRLPGIQAFQLSTAPPSFLATYVPEAKGQPAVVRIHDRKQCSQGEALARKSFFKSSSVNMLWNNGSTSLLVMAFSDDDKSNQSYYGESKLYYLKSDGSQEGAVPLSKEGPIHDAQWSPTGNEFIVVYGFMPAKATLFDLRCRPLFEFGTGPYNTVKWNPFGTFVCLAGFGNLPGDMSIWDRETSKPLGSTKSPCSVTCEWSPDGRMIMTASTAPRLQVDNGIKIYKYTGALLDEKRIDKLYQADWQPGQFTHRPASPPSSKAAQTPQKGTTATAKPAAYRPPHAAAVDRVRAQLLGEEEEKPSGGELSKSALKNKKRREKQKQKAEETSTPTDNSKPETATEPSLGRNICSVSSPRTLSNVVPGMHAEDTGDEVSKKVRALTKKLRQIEEIKTKLAGGQTPTESQKTKLDQEESVREELSKLQLVS